MIANGIAAEGNSPAVAAADLQAALGPNLATIQAILAALEAAIPAI